MSEKKSLRQDIIDREVDKLTDFIEEAIKNNQTPWRREWDTKHAIAHNPYTGSIYQGMNERLLRFNTLIRGYETNAYLTFNNVKELGGFVKKGEKAQTLIHFSRIPLTEEDIQKRLKEYEQRTGKKASKEIEDKIREEDKPFIRPFSVFNLDQCEFDYEKLREHQTKKGILKTLEEVKSDKEIKTIEIVEEIIKNSQISFRENALGRAFYDSRDDYISLPPRKAFKDEKGYYATALHELGHATGHESRLNRKLGNSFGTEDYAQEELRAELFSFLQGQNLSLNFDFDNHTSYLKSWQKVAKDGIREAVKDSFKMCDYVEKNWYPSKERKQEQELKIDLAKRQDGSIEEAKLTRAGEEVKPHSTKKEKIEALYKEDERVRITPLNDKGEIEGLLKEYDNLGQLRLAEVYIAGKKEGESIELYQDGLIECIENYKHDLLNGKREIWDHDGNSIAKETHYKDDLKHGVEKKFYESGGIATEENYRNGIKEGEAKAYHPNGQLQYIVTYKNGKKEGEERSYYQTGELRSLGNYKNGQEIGTHKNFFPDGSIAFETHYKEDKKTLYYPQDRKKIDIPYSKTEKRVSPQVRAEQEKKAQKQGRRR